jgi:hypothetical protein
MKRESSKLRARRAPNAERRIKTYPVDITLKMSRRDPSTSLGMTGIGCRHDEAEEEAGDEAAEVSGHAHLRSDKVENQLHEDDDENVAQTLSSQWKVTMAKKKAGPGSDHSHNAAGSADQLERSEKSKSR